MLVNSTTSSSNDLFLVKYDPAGGVIWAKSISGAANETVLSMTIDATDNIYLTGYFISPTINFGAVSLTNPSSGSTEMYLVKYDTAGTAIWARKPTAGADCMSTSVITDVPGNIYVAGYYGGSSVTFGSTVLINSGTFPTNDVFLVKYNSAGTVLWAKHTTGANDEEIRNGLSVDVLGSVYMTGKFYGSTLSFGTTTLTNLHPTEGDIFLAKYDSAGSIIWARSWGGNNNDETYKSATDALGNVYIAGYFMSDSIKFGTTTLLNVGTGFSALNIFLVKVDTAGNVIWAKGAGGAGIEGITSLTIDAGNNIYIGGYFQSPTISFGSFTLSNSGANNMFIAKYNSSGSALWALGADTGNVNGPLVLPDGADIYIAVGFTGYYCKLSPYTMPNTSSVYIRSDLLIAKYADATLNLMSAKQENNSIRVYPNPSNGNLTINLGSSEYKKIIVYDLTGRSVYNAQLTDGFTEAQVDMRNYVPGFYYLHAVSQSRTEIVRFVIDR